MSYLLNYKNWRALYESTALNESLDTNIVSWSGQIASVEIGNEVSGNANSFPIRLDLDKTTNNATFSQMTKLVGKQALPGLRIGDSGVAAESYQEAVFGLILLGLGQYANSFDAINSVEAIETLVPKLNFSLEKGELTQLLGKSADLIDTQGGIQSGVRIVNSGKLQNSSLMNICGYINAFNLQNWASGSFKQYDPSKILNSDNIVDLTSTNSESVVVEKGFLMLVSPSSTSITGGARGTSDQLVQGEEGKTGSAEISFYVGKSDTDADGVKVDANHPKVKEIGDKIISYLGDTGVADSMTLTSSASPEFAPEKGGPKTLADYATKKKPTSGTAAPASVVDMYDQNAKLAYDRGVTFSNALTQYLGGHVKANSIKVGWKISTDAPGNGRNISYNIATQSVAPAVIQKTTYQGAKAEVTKADNGIYTYKIKFNASALVAAGKGKSQPYESLKVGDMIRIKGAITDPRTGKTIFSDKGKDEKEVKVTKVQDNKVYVQVPKKDENDQVIEGQFVDKEIVKERYLGLAAKQAKAEAGV